MKKENLPEEVLKFFRLHGKRGGKKAAAEMTAEERSARATKASQKAAEVRMKRAAAKRKTTKKSEA